MATDIRLAIGDGDVTDDLQLDGVTGYGVVDGTFSAPPAGPGQRYRIISWTEAVLGSSGDDLWARIAAIQTKLSQAAAAQGAYGHGTRCTLSIKLGDSSNYVYADIVNGVIDVTPANITGPLVENAWAPMVNVSLLCEPYLRGAPVTTTVSGTITATAGSFATPGNAGSGGLFVADVPGDVPALARHIITDVSTGSQITQRYRIGSFAMRDPAGVFGASDFTPWVDDTPSGAGSATSDATAVGSAGSQITLSSVMQRIASYAKPSAQFMTGLFDVYVRAKDSNTILGTPTLTAAGVQNDVNMYVRQAITIGRASASSLAPVWGRETRPGSTLLIGVAINSRTITITTPTGYTASAAARAHATGAARVAWFYIENSGPRSGAETITLSGATKCSAVLYEVVGAAIGGAAIDIEVSNEGTSATTVVASGTLAQAREMIFQAGMSDGSSWTSLTSGFTDQTTTLLSDTYDSAFGYARSVSTTTQNVTFDPLGAANVVGALISVRQAPNLAPNIPVGTYEVCVVAATAGAESLSPASNVMTAVVTQTDCVIYAEWDLGSGSPDHHRLYYRISGGSWEYYASPASSGTYNAYIIADDAGTVGDPPTITSNASNVRLAVALSSGATVHYTKPVRTTVGSSTWEWLYCGTVPLPPMPAIDGGSPRDWIVYVEASHPVPVGTLDVDCAVFVPHPVPSNGNAHYVVSEYTGLDLATLRTHRIETRRDGRTFGYLTATGGDTEAGHLAVHGDSLIGPGDAWIVVVPDVTGGASDIVNTKYTHQIVYTPRFIWLRGA